MTACIRLFLLVEVVTFVLASLIHFGYIVDGYEHEGARIPEAVIAAALLIGLGASLARPDLTATAGTVAQAFALLGTLLGLFLVAIGVGPRAVPDVIYHIAILAVLAWGLSVAWRSRATERSVA